MLNASWEDLGVFVCHQMLADLGWTVMECAGSDGCVVTINGNVMVMLCISLIVVCYVIGDV